MRFGRTNPRFLMAPEGDAAGGAGGDPNGGQNVQPAGDAGAAPAQPGMSDLLNELKAMNQRLAATEQFTQTFQQLLTQPQQGGSQGGGNQDPPPYVDPETEKLLKQYQAQQQVQLGTVQDQLDQLQFNQLAANAGLTPEQIAETEKIYTNWRRNGMSLTTRDARGNLTSQPLSRLDALKFYAGHSQLAGNVAQKGQTPDAEAARRAGNQDAITERGTQRRGAAAPVDPEKIPRGDRLKDGGYWSQVLDKDGF